MESKNRKRLILIPVFLTVVFSSFAQNQSQTDSLVRLMKAKSLELIDKDGAAFRKAVDATFLHNGTYLICDTALWNVDEKVINCQGHVKLMQEETILTSESLDYFIEQDLAEFRGSTVELSNKKKNILRTRNLDYNTRDSLAIFRRGASMKDEHGQVIESEDGTYSSAKKMFTFTGNVDMFTDSIFVKTSYLEYDSDKERANFVAHIDFWKDDNMLSAGSGWYDRASETFFFKDDVHGLSQNQECWSDTLYVFKIPKNVLLKSNAQVRDTSRHISGVANYVFYVDSLSRITMKDQAAAILETKQKDKIDTVYFGADEMVYDSVKKCDVKDSELNAAQTRLAEIEADAVAAYRKKVAEEAAAQEQKRIDEANASNEILPGMKTTPKAKQNEAASAESVTPANDSRVSSGTDKNSPADSLAVQKDSLAVADSLQGPDTTKIGFLLARRNVRVFKRDMQVLCDSLMYNDLDSIARLYKRPLVWNETVRQYSADSLFLLIRNGGAERASLMSNAFISVKESDKFFDQISGTDVMAYFDENTQLKRFDALGGAKALFYLKENDAIATVNIVNCKMMTANLTDGELDSVHYFEQPQNDAYPVVQLPDNEHKLKGYEWYPEKRPESPEAITKIKLKDSEREYYESRPRTSFRYTRVYFPGYINGVYEEIEQAKIKKRTASQKQDSEIQTDSVAVADSLTVLEEPFDRLDSLSLADSLAVADSLEFDTDSLAVNADSLAVDHEPSQVTDTLSARDQAKQKKELARQMRIAHRDAVWAKKDARDAEKAAAREQKALERKRERTKKLYIRQMKREAKENAVLQKYIDKYQKIKDRKDERKPESGPEPEQSTD